MATIEFPIPPAVLGRCIDRASSGIDAVDSPDELVWSRSLRLICEEIRRHYLETVGRECEVATIRVGKVQIEIPHKVRFTFENAAAAEDFRRWWEISFLSCLDASSVVLPSPP